jgi:hypothetical protein
VCGAGRELYFLDLKSRLVAVPVSGGSPLVFGDPVPLFEARTTGGPIAVLGTRAQYAVSADGQRFLLNQEVVEGRTRFFAILNWQQLVERRQA